MCLFHAMFGGRCDPAELADNRASSQSSQSNGRLNRTSVYHTRTSVLVEELKASYTDPYDQPLYEHVRRRFIAQLQEYGVTAERCVAMGCMHESETLLQHSAKWDTI